MREGTTGSVSAGKKRNPFFILKQKQIKKKTQKSLYIQLMHNRVRLKKEQKKKKENKDFIALSGMAKFGKVIDLNNKSYMIILTWSTAQYSTSYICVYGVILERNMLV